MSRKLILICAAFIFSLLICGKAHAFIIINEFLADPASGISGDANNDGVTSYSQDEFIEIVNTSDTAVDLSGWYLNDAIGTRHVFSAGVTLQPYSYLVIFGGGSPSFSEIYWQVASSGSLGLNNSGDTITLYDLNGDIISTVLYGREGGKDQSLARFPEGIGDDFILHSLIDGSAGSLYSPGTSINGKIAYYPAVPESSTALLFGLGYMFAAIKKDKPKYKTKYGYC